MLGAMTSFRERRTFLLGAAAVVVSACTSSGESDAASPTTGAPATTTSAVDPSTTLDSATTLAESTGSVSELEVLTPDMFNTSAGCALTPTSTSGPFPTINRMDRRVIHEGLPGHPLRLGLQVVNDACEPVPNAVVDIWHTDATGDYSEYEDNGSGKDDGAGSTFCRGEQTADANGIVEFETIYPGWYDGRAVHIHVAVMQDGENIFTGQLYFDEAYSEAIYQTGEYAAFGPPDTPWSSDRIVGDPTTDGTGIVLSEAATGIGPGTLGLAVLSVPGETAGV